MATVKILELQANVDGAVKGLNKVDAEIENINKGLEATEKGFVNSNKDAEKLNTTIEKTGNASVTARKGFKAMGVALKAVGIGLLIKGLSLVSELFMTNQKVVDGFNTAINMVTIAFNDLFQFVSKNVGSVTQFFKSIFDDPLQSIKNLGVAIKNNIIERVKSGIEVLGLLGTAIKKVFEGDFDGAIETAKMAGKEYIDVLTGVDNSVDKVTEVVEEAIPAITNYTQSTYESAKANVELAKSAELAQVVNQGLIEQFDRQAEQQRQIRDDEFKTIEERIEANNKLKEVLDEQEAAMLKNVDTQIQQAQTTFNLNKTQENLIALIEAKNEKLAVEAQIEGFRSEQLTNKVALEKELIELNQTSIDGTNERAIAERKATDELIEDDVKRIEAQRLTLNEEIRIETERLERKREFFAEGTQARKDADEELLNFISESNIQKEQLANDLANAEIVADNKIREAKEANQQALISATSSALGSIAQLAGEGTKVGKAAALADVLINTASGISNAIAGATAAGAATGVAAPISTPLFIAQMVAQVLGGIAKAKAILSKVKGPSSASVPSSVPTGGGSQPPSFNVVGNSGVNQIAQAVGQQGPVQAFVVAGAVTNQQQLDNAIVDTATF